MASALPTPPLTTCLRVNTAVAAPERVLELLAAAAQEGGLGPDVLPRQHPDIPEAILLPGTGPHAVDYTPAGGKEVVVSRKAGEAVLRGAEVFAPGVLACSPGVSAGDVVVVSIALETGPGGKTSGLLRGYRLGSDPALEAGLPPRIQLGLGQSAMARAEMFRVQRGVAVTLTARVHRPGAPACQLADGAVMLQNLPSLAAAAALDPGPGTRVLDMCAAPGGKTTALAGRLAAAGRGGVVIALDRSHAKVSKIRELAAECGVADYVIAYKADAATCIRPGGDGGNRGSICLVRGEEETAPSSAPAAVAPVEISEGLRRRLERQAAARLRHKHSAVVSAHTIEGRQAVCPGFDPESFDHVLCDAPCSALGLRPRLLHGHTVEELRGTAQYQRRILTAGVAALRPGGTLVFSTCTISPLENEGNVRWLLDNFPELRLVPATPRIGEQGLTGPGLLTQEEAACVQRFDPGTTGSLDTIGFFISKFHKQGRT